MMIYSEFNDINRIELKDLIKDKDAQKKWENADSNIK